MEEIRIGRCDNECAVLINARALPAESGGGYEKMSFVRYDSDFRGHGYAAEYRCIPTSA
jgi:hypothetical protein